MLNAVTPFDALVETPMGPVGIRSKSGSVVQIEFYSGDCPVLAPGDSFAEAVVREIEAYLRDPQTPFSIPLAPEGTRFQQQVWQTLKKIPVGCVRTYGDLARALSTSPRAVGGACRANPCPILIPCHRVVGAHGKGGFAGATSGRWMVIKERLLQHEGVVWP